MRFIRCGEYVVDRDLSVLKCATGEIALEPKLFDLLIYLCSNPDKIISRQELLDNVWSGSIVTDNAINKIVANLRKLLADDPKKPTYIQTVPRKGYRLICDVEVFDEKVEPITKNRDRGSFQVINLLGLVIILLATTLFFILDDSKVSPVRSQILTRLPGAEYSGLIDPSLTYLLFLKQDEYTGSVQLWRKDLNTQQEYRVKNSPTGIQWLFAIEESSGELFYVQRENAQCTVNRVGWNSSHSLSTPVKLFDCRKPWISDIVLLPDSQQIFYTANSRFIENRQIYTFDVQTAKHDQFNHPELDGLSHYQLDLSPDQSTLLILSTASDFRSQLFTLELTSQKLTHHQTLDHWVGSAIWHHDSTHIVHMAEPPSHNLIVSDLSGKRTQVLLSNSEYLSQDLVRVPNGDDFLVSTILDNYNIRWLTQSKGGSKHNSTVFDFIPTLSHQRAQYAFASKRSGKTQIYLADQIYGDIRQLTHFSGYELISDMAFSPDDQSLLLIQQHQLLYLPVGTLDAVPPNVIFSTSNKIVDADWLNNRWLSVNIWNTSNNTENMFLLDVVTNEQIQIDPNWYMAVTDHNDTDSLYLVSYPDNHIYKTSLSVLLEEQVLSQHRLKSLDKSIPYDAYQMEVFKGDIYYLRYTNPGYTLGMLSDKLGNTEYQLKNIYGYDVSEHGLIVSEQVSFEGDILRTYAFP